MMGRDMKIEVRCNLGYPYPSFSGRLFRPEWASPAALKKVMVILHAHGCGFSFGVRISELQGTLLFTEQHEAMIPPFGFGCRV